MGIITEITLELMIGRTNVALAEYNLKLPTVFFFDADVTAGYNSLMDTGVPHTNAPHIEFPPMENLVDEYDDSSNPVVVAFASDGADVFYKISSGHKFIYNVCVNNSRMYGIDDVKRVHIHLTEEVCQAYLGEAAEADGSSQSTDEEEIIRRITY